MTNQNKAIEMASVETRRNQLEERYQIWPRDTVATHFQKVCKAYSQRPYLYIEEQALTYEQVWQDALLYAASFVQLGVKRRDHIAVLMNNQASYPSLMIAASIVGAVFIPINAMFSKNELAYILQQSDTQFLILEQTIKDKAHGANVTQLLAEEDFKKDSWLHTVVCLENEKQPGVSNSFLTWKEFTGKAEMAPSPSIQTMLQQSAYPDEVAIILYTSGSTGYPKGVMLTSDMILRCAYSTCLSRAIENGRVTFAPLPFYHCFAIIEAIFAMSFVGGSFISALGASPLQSLELMEKYQANDYLCVPSMLVPLVNHPRVEEFELSHLFAAWCGAAPAPVPVWKKAIDTLGLTEIITGYGQTEVASSGVTTEIGDSLDLITTRVGRPKLGGSSGLPEFQESTVQYKTIDPETLENLPEGSIGELVVRGATVTKGYYNKPMETAETIDKDGWLRTGDVGRIDESGYLQVLGRSKEMYKVSGELVAPREVENIIYEHPSVNQVQVIGVPDALTTEIGAAFIELHEGKHTNRKDIADWCASQLARFKIPRHFWFISAKDWPMTSTGKIQKFRLEEIAKEKLPS